MTSGIAKLSLAGRDALKGPRVRPDPARDAFLASYPRSGNTWLRAALFDCVTGRAPRNLAELDTVIIDEHAPPHERDVPAEARCTPSGGTIVKTHFAFHLQRPYAMACHVVRDPRDAIPSFWKFLAGKKQAQGFEDFVEAAVLGGVWPCSWFESAQSWIVCGAQRIGRFAMVRYEDLVAADAGSIERLAYGLGLGSAETLGARLRAYDLDRMRALEAAGNRKGERPAAPGEDRFIGRGRASREMRDHVDSRIRAMAPHWLTLMNRLSYET